MTLSLTRTRARVRESDQIGDFEYFGITCFRLACVPSQTDKEICHLSRMCVNDGLSGQAKCHISVHLVKMYCQLVAIPRQSENE